MSEEVLKLIPDDKSYMPQQEKAEEARLLLEDFFPDGEQAEVQFSDKLLFIDSGENTVTVGCPLCGSESDLNEDENSNWWFQLTNTITSEGTNLETLEVKMPCCRKQSLIQNINYFGSAGFAKFELCIWNPYDSISDQQVEQLERLLGCKLKQVWAHY